MPPTTEQITERPVFDVYGTMLILGFVATLGATLILRQELIENWGWAVEKTDAAFTNRAVNITQINDNPEKYPNYVKVTETDLKEWRLIKGENTPFPVSSFAWPEGYDPLENPVKPGADNLSGIPEAQRGALMKAYQPGGEGAAPAPGAAAAPGTEKAPGAEPAAPDKKEETKPEEKKTEEKKLAE